MLQPRAKCSCCPPHPHSRGNPVASPSQPSPLLCHLSPILLPRGSSPAAAGDLRTRRALMAASSPWQRGAAPASVRRRALAGRAGVGPLRRRPRSRGAAEAPASREGASLPRSAGGQAPGQDPPRASAVAGRDPPRSSSARGAARLPGPLRLETSAPPQQLTSLCSPLESHALTCGRPSFAGREVGPAGLLPRRGRGTPPPGAA
jgi:hypothetical protein